MSVPTFVPGGVTAFTTADGSVCLQGARSGALRMALEAGDDASLKQYFKKCIDDLRAVWAQMPTLDSITAISNAKSLLDAEDDITESLMFF